MASQVDQVRPLDAVEGKDAVNRQAIDIPVDPAVARGEVEPHVSGQVLETVGDALGTTEETVKNSLFRATRKLRNELGGLR